MGRILVIKTGKTYDAIRERHGCFEDWMAAGLGVGAGDIEVVRVFEGELLPPSLTGVRGILITGSPAMVTDRHPWSEATARWLARQLLEQRQAVPTLGICYGHQLLAHAFGGVVDYNPNGREIGSVDILAETALDDDPLLGALAFPLRANVTHLQSVRVLPPGARRLASSRLEPHQAFSLRGHIWGLQFHPEFSDDIMQSYIELLAPRLQAEGISPQQAAASVGACRGSGEVLRRFAALTEAREASLRAAAVLA